MTDPNYDAIPAPRSSRGPFGLKKEEYIKLTKLPSIGDWSIKKHSKYVEIKYMIIADKQKISKANFKVDKYYYDVECDSWIVKDSNGGYHRLEWGCVCQDKYEDHDVVNKLLKM